VSVYNTVCSRRSLRLYHSTASLVVMLMLSWWYIGTIYQNATYREPRTILIPGHIITNFITHDKLRSRGNIVSILLVYSLNCILHILDCIMDHPWVIRDSDPYASTSFTVKSIYTVLPASTPQVNERVHIVNMIN
jgi:hypothetical protein